MKTELEKLIERIILEEAKKQEFAPAPKMGDIDPTPEDDKDRPFMDDRPKDGMDVSQHHKMMHAESCGKEHMSEEEDDEDTIEEINAIGAGGVSATSAGSAWDSNKEEHEHMWSGDEPDKFGKKNKSSVKKEEKIGKTGKNDSTTKFQMGSSLPDELYNRTNDGKPTRDPGVPGGKANKRDKKKG